MNEIRESFAPPIGFFIFAELRFRMTSCTRQIEHGQVDRATLLPQRAAPLRVTTPLTKTTSSSSADELRRPPPPIPVPTPTPPMLVPTDTPVLFNNPDPIPF